MAGASGNHGAIFCTTAGVNITSKDGGIQSFQQSTYNTTDSDRQSLALYAGNTASKSAGGHLLNNIGLLASATGGDNNYSFYGVAGELYNSGPASFDGLLTIRSLTVSNLLGSGPVDLSAATEIKLNSNVSGFEVPGSVTENPRVGLGTLLGNGYQLQVKNTVPGNLTMGLQVGLDTDVAPGIRGGLVLSRGAGGSFNNNEAIFVYAANNNEFVNGSATNDVVIANQNSEAGRRLLFSSDGATSTIGAQLESTGVFQAKTVKTGAAMGTGATWASGTGVPSGAPTGGTVGSMFSRTDGTAGSCLYVWNGAIWTAIA
jgi:hypothetical protein